MSDNVSVRQIRADDVSLRLAAGTVEGEVALVINVGRDEATGDGGEDVLVVEGTAQTLRGLVYAGFSLPIPAGAALVDFPDTIAELQP